LIEERKNDVAAVTEVPCRYERSFDGTVATLKLDGELDMATAPDLTHCFHLLVDEGHVRVVADMSELDFIDSTGLGALVGGLKRLREHDGDIVLKDPKPLVVKLLALTGLDKVFTVV
jgi:anti-sigma B factor antagonist